RGRQPLGGRDEIVEDVLFSIEHARLMPAVAVFAAAAQVSRRDGSPAVEPHEIRRIERWGEADVETAISSQQNRARKWARGLRSLFSHQEHRHLRAVS